MANQENWTSVMFERGPDVVKQAIMKWQDNELIGDLINRSLKNVDDTEQVSQIVGFKQDPKSSQTQESSIKLEANMPLAVTKTYSIAYLVIYLTNVKEPNVNHGASSTELSALDVLMKMQRKYDNWPDERFVFSLFSLTVCN